MKLRHQDTPACENYRENTRVSMYMIELQMQSNGYCINTLQGFSFRPKAGVAAEDPDFGATPTPA